MWPLRAKVRLTIMDKEASKPTVKEVKEQEVYMGQAAAKRGHAQAQLEVGTRHLHGNQLPKDLDRAIEWLEKAAAQGVGQAAQSLGHLYENMLGQKADKEKAIEWYYRAAVAFQKAGNKEDARAVIRHLESLTAKHPTVLGLVAKLEKLVAGQG